MVLRLRHPALEKRVPKPAAGITTFMDLGAMTSTGLGKYFFSKLLSYSYILDGEYKE